MDARLHSLEWARSWGTGSGLMGAIVGVALLSGCGGGEASDGTLVVRDSLGVRIVETVTPAWANEAGWLVHSEAEVSIGAIEGEEAYQFYFVSDAVRIPDGRILVANRGTSEVRVFSSQGRYLRMIGGEGDGPGELRSPRQIFAGQGDTIHVVDLRSVSTFRLSEGFLASHPWGLPPLGRLSDGSVVSLGWTAGVDPFQLGQVRDSLAMVRYEPGQQLDDTLRVVAGRDTYRMERGGGIAQYSLPFGREPQVAVVDDRVVTGDGSDFEIMVLASTGELVEILRRRDLERQLTRSLISQHEQRIVGEAGSEEQQRLWRQIFADWSYPDRWPAFDDLLVDAEANIWVKHYTIDPDQAVPWSVFSSEGHWLGEVDVPAGLRVTDIGSDHVLGVMTDDFGVEYVRVHTLAK